jgi:hypothetical protein
MLLLAEALVHEHIRQLVPEEHFIDCLSHTILALKGFSHILPVCGKYANVLEEAMTDVKSKSLFMSNIAKGRIFI